MAGLALTRGGAPSGLSKETSEENEKGVLVPRDVSARLKRCSQPSLCAKFGGAWMRKTGREWIGKETEE